MSFDIIKQLRAVDPESRPAILNEMYQGNLAFFKSKHPILYQFINTTPCPYHIDITETFVNVVDERTGFVAHPEAGLDQFAEILGDWTHEAWVDLFNFQIPMLDQYPLHYKIVNAFSSRLHNTFPELSERLAGGRINLKTIEVDRRFSPPVVFLGIFHGLHIAHYLDRTDLTTALFIEPEPERFEVSCYFLDYAEIERRFGTLYLAIGDTTTAPSIESFFSLLHITPMMWTRILCGYPFDKAFFYIESIKSLQATNTNLLYPLDNELEGLVHGAINLNQGLPLLTSRPRVSRQCKIAVVATGPSLVNDLDWLKRNQNNLIIFAVHSSVKILRKHGIKPDFQFNLDAIINYDFINTLELFPDVPFVTDYKAPPHIISEFETPLLCAETHKNAVVHFFTSLTETHPSTTNLAFSFACFINPTAIYLIGCDCGYRTLKQDHAKGSFYEESFHPEQHISYAKSALQSLVKPNFKNTEPIQTISQHLRTKIVIERCIANNANDISIFNFSDGADIIGAKAKHSYDIYLNNYKNKQNDLRKIINSFYPSKEHVNWSVYTTSGTEILNQLRTNLIKHFTLDEFGWNEFSKSFNNALYGAFTDSRIKQNDHRMDCFCRILSDLLCVWYRSIILVDDIDKAEKIYATGLHYLQKSLDELEWPGAIDHIQHNFDEFISHEWKIYFSKICSKKGDFVRAERLISLAYDENPLIKDHFAKLGWQLAESQQWQQALEVAVQDEKRNRLSPTWQVHLAQLYGRHGNFGHAVELIEEAYSADRDIKNGFARLGWIYAEKRRWPIALQLAERDMVAGRVSPGWRVNIAQLLARNGNFDQAGQLISNAYDEHPDIKDGFARLAWIKMETSDWHSAHELLLQDYVQGRISPARKIHFAIVKGCLQRWSEAITLVSEAYSEDALLCDGFSHLGWWGYLLGKGLDFFEDQIAKDKASKTQRVKHIIFRAYYLTLTFKDDKVSNLITQGYRNDPGVDSWFTNIGWLHIRLGNYHRGLELMKLDYMLGRMNHAWLASYAITLGICRKKKQAMDILKDLSLNNQDNTIYPVGFTVFPEACMTLGQLQMFIASGKNYEDLKKYSKPNHTSFLVKSHINPVD